MGAQIWWKWVSSPQKPRAQIWNAKYANNRPQEELIRITTVDTGSLIWNAAKQHKELIQKHSFWEIRDGRTALFWVDSWQQRPKIAKILPPPNHDGNNLNQTDHVSQYWIQSAKQGFRQWKPTEQIIHHETEDFYSDL